MAADAESQRIANVEGTRHMVELAEAVEAGRVHMVSSIAAAGLYKGTWREDMFEEAEDLDTHPYFRTKHESEAVVRNECARPWRVYRPGIVVGDSETGEMDKIDGPYYFFKLIRASATRCRSGCRCSGVEGREINIVPVDFVVAAMDHIAHLDGLDGRAFHLTDPNPQTAGEVIDIFARAAHAPQSSVKSRRAGSTLPSRSRASPMLGGPARRTSPSTRCSPTSASRARCSIYVNYPTHFDSRQTQAALEGTGITVPPLEAYAGKLWDYWERHLDPDLYRDRTLVGRARGRAGIIGGAGQFVEQQIPDEVLRLRPPPARQRLARAGRARPGRDGHRRVVGNRQSAAMKIADAGGTVLLVARTPEKLEETKEQIEAGGGTAYIHRCDLSDMEDIDRMADEVLDAARPRRRAGQQRRPLDPALDRALLRPPPRLRADDAAQLLRRRCG